MTDPHRLRPAGILSALCAAALACSLGAPDNVPTPVVVSGLDATATGEPGPESGSERETSTPLQPTISATPALQVGMSVGTLQLGDVQASQTAIADSVPTLDEAAGEPYDPFDAVRAAFSIQRTIRAASADDRYLWSTIWCASDADVLATTLAQIRIDLTVEGRPLAIDRALRRTWAPDTGPQRCQSIDIAVAGWTSLRTHLETTITFGAPLDNGLAHYPAGRLTRRYEVLAPEATGEPNRYWLDGVAFTYRPDLAHSLDVRDVPEVLYGSPDVHLPGDIQPAYTEVQLNATDTREPYATRFVRVYDADALAALSVAARDGIESLRAFTASRPDTPTPAVAIGTSLPMFTGRVRSFTFNGGHGVSYLTQYGFMVGPITRDLVYVFQAVTDDGRFIHGEYPVQAAGLPADPMDPAANEAAMNDFDAYVADVRAKLDQLDPASFTPTITWPDETASICSAVPLYGTWM